MKRSFWTMVLVLITVSSGWALYVGAQELQSQLPMAPGAESQDRLRYQFTDHFFQQQGVQFEIFLRLDKFTGQTWRYHASQPEWKLIPEAANTAPSADRENRYELLSHVYRDQLGVQQELFLRVDYINGRSWKYQGMAGTWEEVKIEAAPVPTPAAGPADTAPAPIVAPQESEPASTKDAAAPAA